MFNRKSQKESFWVGLEALFLLFLFTKKRCDPFNMQWYTHGQKSRFFYTNGTAVIVDALPAILDFFQFSHVVEAV